MSKVSIQMCCFNGEEFLSNAVSSIIAQTYTNWELIFWDNCSTDNSAEIIKSYKDDRIKYYCAPEHTDLGGGRAGSWPLLSGDLIAFLDADDTWQPNKLELQVSEFDDPSVVIVAGNVMWENRCHGELIYNEKDPFSDKSTGNLLKHYFLSLPSIMIRRSSIDNLEYAFDQNFSHIADFDLMLRASTQGKIMVLAEHVATWRVRMESQTWAKRKTFYIEHLKWIEKHKHKVWIKPFAYEFQIHTILVVLKKLYFAVIDGQYSVSETTGYVYFLDRTAFFLFSLFSLPPLKLVINYHFTMRIKKWL